MALGNGQLQNVRGPGVRVILAALIGSPLLLAACSHTEVRQHANFDNQQRSIAVPPHKRGLMAAMIKELAAAGWMVAVEPAAPKAAADKKTGRAPESAPDTAKPNAATSATTRAKTRYRMTAKYRDIDYCRGGRIYIYDVAIIDNESGAPVLEQSGRDCDRDIVAKFKAALAPKSS